MRPGLALGCHPAAQILGLVNLGPSMETQGLRSEEAIAADIQASALLRNATSTRRLQKLGESGRRWRVLGSVLRISEFSQSHRHALRIAECQHAG